MSFAALFQHIDDCAECNHVSLDLCDEGKRIRDAAAERARVMTSPGRVDESGERQERKV